MTTPRETLWDIELHTAAKHEILRRYLGAWFGILGQSIPHILYIDGFCGPGRYRGGEDGSPLIALKTALSHSKLAHAQISFLFIDERPDRIEHLESELKALDIPSNYHVYPTVSNFDHTLTDILDDAERKGVKLVPTFAFIDPFGFKGVPFSLVQRLLRNPRTEVFINVMTSFINRFLDPSSGVQQHIVDLFGTTEAIQTAQSLNRLDDLRQLYFRQLQREARFVRYFEMCDEYNKTIYYLFFAGNHRLGHVKMKEAFWKVDCQSGYKFSDRSNPRQPVLFTLDPTYELARILREKYVGQTQSTEAIVSFVEDETAFIASHARKALDRLEQEGKLMVDAIKLDGKKRRKRTFPDGVIVHFPK